METLGRREIFNFNSSLWLKAEISVTRINDLRQNICIFVRSMEPSLIKGPNE